MSKPYMFNPKRSEQSEHTDPNHASAMGTNVNGPGRDEHREELLRIELFNNGSNDASSLILYSKMKEVVNCFQRKNGSLCTSYSPARKIPDRDDVRSLFTLSAEGLTRDELKKLLGELINCL